MTVNVAMGRPVRRTAVAARRPWILVGSLLALAVVCTLVSLTIGATRIPFSDVLTALSGQRTTDGAEVVLDFQLPRVLLCWVVGIGLAVSGGVMQGVVRNPLAAPDIIGVTKGAGFAGMLLVLTLPGASVALVPPAAFAGGVVGAGLVYLFAYRRGVSPVRLALVGIAVSATFEAGIRYLLVKYPLDVNASLIWLTGSLFGRSMDTVWMALPWIAVLVPAVLVMARRLDVLGLGDDLATGLGEPVERTRRNLLLLGVALASVCVAVAGTITFVGLIAPHIARRLVGGRHVVLLSAAAMIGVLLMLLADTVGRGIAPPLEIPAGVVTAVIGGPYFLYLLVKLGK
ncbi:FecCD family ABC transporter permease [Streptomyces chiangmaiensis]|uniref:Iron chelate uptake ABC transporter family permease subunit n=1 Tax=Streptomyces chiangmaiensis TaxID=766497 RepID=A0ABU7FIS6_9ACTN|nr:iron chelate uptake ABC transporter family permease subunit [Streptomyces chiangmaiensis]MED7824000.1 iron chelate uptake ABC transporter family permease subunit [Streptomyces chiangmaiensis]